MAKKTWIKLKRGLLEPKHRDALGIRIWLYLYILDNTDWGSGQVLEWRDSDAADDLQMPQRTVRDQRVKLENDDYIQCSQGHHKQIITVMNWTDPRLHAETTINHGDNNLPPLENNGHGDNHGDIHGDNHGNMQLDTPTSIKDTTYHITSPEELRGFFLEKTMLHMNYVPANKKEWDGWFCEWSKNGVTCEIIDKAVNKSKTGHKKYPVTSPKSINTNIANLLMEREQSHAALEGYTAA